MQERVLWGRNTSVNVQKVIWTLAEVGIDYERIDAGGSFGGLDTPAFGAMNPNRRIPVFKDGDLIVWESSAIVRYLAAQYGAGELWPESPAERAVSDQWADWCNTTFQPAWLEVFVQLVRTPPSRRDSTRVKTCTDVANACFAILDKALAEREFLGGAHPSYADILCGSALYRWSRMEVARIDTTSVDAWHARLRARPGFVAGVEVDFSTLMAHD